jgi:hypothetical protein
MMLGLTEEGEAEPERDPTLVITGGHLPGRYRMPTSWPMATASWRVETPSFRYTARA